jgi:hypothetical protein
MTYTSDEHLHPMELCIDHGIKVQVECWECEGISQMYWCTGSLSCHGEIRQNDLVGLKQRPGTCYSVLIGCLPWQLQRIFKIMSLNEDGAFIEFQLSLELPRICDN